MTQNIIVASGNTKPIDNIVHGCQSSSYSVEMSHTQYHSVKSAVSRSQLVQMLKSPKHFHAYCSNPHPKETPSQSLGRLVHLSVLEPSIFARTVAHTDENKGTFHYKKFVFENSGKEIITSSLYEQVTTIRDAVLNATVPNNSDTNFGSLLKYGDTEKTIFWTDDETGIQLRIRVDFLIKCLIFDLKTVGDARQDAFLYLQAIPNNYDFQAAMYHEGVKALTGESLNFSFITVETAEPNGVCFHETGPGAEFFENGMRKYRYALRQLARARKSNEFNGYENTYFAMDKISKYHIFVPPDL